MTHSVYISARLIQVTTWLIQCMFLHGSFSIHLYKAHSASISAWRIQETTWLIQCMFLHGSFSIHLCMAYSGNYMAHSVYISPWLIQHPSLHGIFRKLHGSFSVCFSMAHSVYISAWRIQETTWLYASTCLLPYEGKTFPMSSATRLLTRHPMGRLRLVGSFRLQVSFTKDPYK